MAADESYVRNQLYLIPLADLHPDPNQPRKYLDATALEELTASVVQHGILEPILFRKENGLLYVVAGERRLAAARKAGLDAIPAVFIDSANHGEIALVENLLRQDLNPVEEAEAMDRLMKDHSYKQDDLVRIFCKSKTNISETLSLTRLPQEVRDECRKDPSVPKNVLIGIARKKQARSMLKAYWLYKAKLNPKKKTAGAKISQAQKAFNDMDAMQTKIVNLDIAAMSPVEKESLAIALENLKQAIQDRLEAITQPAAGKNLA